MAYRAYIGKIKKGKEKDYIEAHKAVWPELIAAMRKAGVENESCFVLGNYIFVYIEASDINATMEVLSADPVNQKWDIFMEPLLEFPVEGCTELFPKMTEVFRM
jgi:L-rhamnose mutarotase